MGCSLFSSTPSARWDAYSWWFLRKVESLGGGKLGRSPPPGNKGSGRDEKVWNGIIEIAGILSGGEVPCERKL